MSLATPPLLLTKRLTTFLHTNLSPQLHTALLTTPSGKLLSHASHQPVSVLRTQCTVASSLWTLHASASSSIPDALPGSGSQSPGPPTAGSKPVTITVQLTGGVVVIRRLKCGLLFVCIGPVADAAEQTPSADGANGGREAALGTASPLQVPGSPSEVDSVLSAGAATTASYTSVGSVNTAGVVAIRRHAEELARWLDDKLGSLRVPEEGVGVAAE